MRLRNTKTFGALFFGPQRAAQSRIHRSSEVAARSGAVHGGSRATEAGDEKLRVCGRDRGAHRRASDESDYQDGLDVNGFNDELISCWISWVMIVSM